MATDPRAFPPDIQAVVEILAAARAANTALVLALSTLAPSELAAHGARAADEGG
jgi:hypothetical protein